MQETWVQSLDWEDPPAGGHGNPLQYSCLENPHGQSSLAATWVADTIEQLSTEQGLVSCISFFFPFIYPHLCHAEFIPSP